MHSPPAGSTTGAFMSPPAAGGVPIASVVGTAFPWEQVDVVSDKGGHAVSLTPPQCRNSNNRPQRCAVTVGATIWRVQ